MTAAVAAPAPIASGKARVALAALDAAGIAALAGLIAGLVVVGMGGRLAMRIAGAMSDPTLIGAARTENGNIVGEVTLNGTLFLLIAGAIQGFLAGPLYALVRPWLRPLRGWAGLAFGLALLGALGQIVIQGSNFDFRKFGVPALNVALFALLFPLYGVLCAIGTARLERAVRVASRVSLSRIAVLLAQLLLGVVFLAAVVGIGGFGLRVLLGATEAPPAPTDLRGLILPFFLAVAVGARLLLGSAYQDARSLPRGVRIATYALLLVPVAAGVQPLFTAVRFLLAG